MSDPFEETRVQAAQSEARARGYNLLVDEAVNMPARITHMALAAPVSASVARFLTYSTSAADAAGAGLDVLLGILDRGDPWPEP